MITNDEYYDLGPEAPTPAVRQSLRNKAKKQRTATTTALQSIAKSSPLKRSQRSKLPRTPTIIPTKRVPTSKRV
jgi:hypothetical protein